VFYGGTGGHYTTFQRPGGRFQGGGIPWVLGRLRETPWIPDRGNRGGVPLVGRQKRFRLQGGALSTKPGWAPVPAGKRGVVGPDAVAQAAAIRTKLLIIRMDRPILRLKYQHGQEDASSSMFRRDDQGLGIQER